MTNDLVSVIVPVYNIEKYLRSCVDSLIDQDYSAIEIILVDDGSTDSSGRICDSYRANNDKIFVMHQPNGGLSSARNSGMGVATGRWIVFVDGDDVVSTNFISALVTAVNFGCADMAMWKGTVFRDGDGFSPRTRGRYEYLSCEDAVRFLLSEKMASTAAWGKMALAEIWRKTPFPVGRVFEDLPVTWKTVGESHKVALFTGDIYGYRKRNGSISEVPSPDAVRDYWVSISQISDESRLATVFDAETQKAFAFRLCLECSRLVEMTVRSKKNGVDTRRIQKKALTLLRRNTWKGVRNSSASMSQKIRILLFFVAPRFSVYLKIILNQCSLRCGKRLKSF